MHIKLSLDHKERNEGNNNNRLLQIVSMCMFLRLWCSVRYNRTGSEVGL